MIVKHDSAPLTSPRITFIAGLIAALTSPLSARSGLQPTSADVEIEEIIVDLPSGMAVAIHILSDDEETRSFVGALVRALTTVDDRPIFNRHGPLVGVHHKQQAEGSAHEQPHLSRYARS